MIFEDDETLRMYVEESLEHLSDIENDLLTIEESGSDLNDELVNNVFRAAHSIKGGAGFMGLSTVKDLSHNLENVLGMIRTGELVPTSTIISILLKAFDRLEELISDIENSNEADVEKHLNDLAAIASGTLAEPEKESVEDNVAICHPEKELRFVVPASEIEEAEKHGKFIYILEYDTERDIRKKNKTLPNVITSLKNSGTIIASSQDLETLESLETDLGENLPLNILFASIIEPDMATTLVDLDDEFICPVTEEMITPVGKEVSPLEEAAPVAEIHEPPPQPVREAEPLPAEAVAETAEEPPVTFAEVKETTVIEENTVENKPGSLEKQNSEQKKESATGNQGQMSLRVNINLLDTLMTLAGELVLGRNQLLQGVTAGNERAVETSSQRINMITSELQEAIMRTRMQPISNIFNKFTRVVRDLSQALAKQVELSMEGKEVELDKTIIEAINDPLTHLVRNSVDHGIESPAERAAAGKNPGGKISLKAFHEAGQVNIEISDDGKGMDGDELMASAIRKGLITEQEAESLTDKEKVALIFLPGFSTAREITDVSGRGVGMDVVKTNLDKLGGIIDIDSTKGAGTTIRIKLPLTLAIIPSQIVSVGNERYAIPQVNLDELLRIPAAQVKEKIEKVGNADVVRLRGALLPLLNLAEVMGIEKTFVNPKDGKVYQDRRTAISDRRSKKIAVGNDPSDADTPGSDLSNKREKSDRRYHASSAINIAVVSAGSFRYGLVVDKLCDSEEIVVKPLGRHLSQCEGFAGATIMGDGKVALILDVASLARMGELASFTGKSAAAEALHEAEALEQTRKDRSALLLFKNGEKDHFAAPLNLVERIERIEAKAIEEVGGLKVVQYRGGTLPLYELSQVTDIQPLSEEKHHEVIVFKITGKEVGLMVTPPVDAVEVDLNIDATTLKQTGIMGSMIVGDHTTLMVDMFEIVKALNPEWIEESTSSSWMYSEKNAEDVKILFAEDSAFFRNQVKGFFEDEGFQVITAEDGAIAWELLEKHGEKVTAVVTDLEMPVMDGFELTKKIKTDSRFSSLPVVALTSLASEEDIRKGKSVGIDSYEIKLDREKLVDVVKSYVFA